METIKNIATVVGCIMSCAALVTLLCKPIREKFTDFVQRTSKQSEMETQLAEIKELLNERSRNAKEFQERVEQTLAITTDFTESQCRTTLKEIFYKYKDTRVLPLYEKKTLLDVEELYLERMHKNHWGKTLIDEMNTWEVDVSDTDIHDFET